MDWSLVLAAIIISVPLTLVFYILWRVQREIAGYHDMVNSRMDQLLDLTASSSHAEGVADERANPGKS